MLFCSPNDYDFLQKIIVWAIPRRRLDYPYNAAGSEAAVKAMFPWIVWPWVRPNELTAEEKLLAFTTSVQRVEHVVARLRIASGISFPVEIAVGCVNSVLNAAGKSCKT